MARHKISRRAARRDAAEQQRRSRAVLHFAGLFVAGLVGFQLLYYGWLVDTRLFADYVAAITRASAMLLRAVGEPVVAEGDVLAAGFRVAVRQGCDGLQPIGIFVAAVLSFPAPWKRRLIGAALGTVLLGTLNVVRVATLYWAGAYHPGIFQTLHVHIWPGALIAAALGAWLLWARTVR